jgi:diguanylate cyclase (GGDEF)-like protein
MTVRHDTPDPESRARVLLVEDDPRAATLTVEMLRTSWPDGLVLAHVQRPGDATEELLERGASCVLLALSRDRGRPLAALEQLHTVAPEVAILVLLPEDDDDLALEAVNRGAQDCLVKSRLYPAQLRRAVTNAISRKRAEVGLLHQALHDPLTGLPNRALFLDRLGVALDRAKRTRSSLAVLFLDVDNFKEINDSMGHGAGDSLLAGLAERLEGLLRPMDTVARFGGDEFTFLFEDLASEREVVLIAERISRAAAAPVRTNGRRGSITVSIGIAIVSDPSTPADSVIREADTAMYRAKELGKSRYELYDETSRERAKQRLELESDLRGAVDRSELRVYYQPRISLDDHQAVLVGFEALVRWQHPERGMITPGEFITIAEETGMIIPIGEFVLLHALNQIARWRRARADLTVSVNLSPRQLLDGRLASTLAATMQTIQLAPDALCLEVTEQAVALDPEVAARALGGLKTIGVRLAIDDYGTGSSLLSNIGRLPLDTLKIHERFIGTLGNNSREAAIVGAVIAFGHALGLSVVAEGVETDAQLAELRALGCDEAQGHLFSPAVPEDQADALLSAG